LQRELVEVFFLFLELTPLGKVLEVMAGCVMVEGHWREREKTVVIWSGSA